ADSGESRELHSRSEGGPGGGAGPDSGRDRNGAGCPARKDWSGETRMTNDLEKSIRGLLDETESLFKKQEALNEALQENWAKFIQPGPDELAGVVVEMNKTYAVVKDLMARVGKS